MAERKILILGGTRFLGPALIREIKKSGQDARITCFHRGLHQDGFPFPDVSHLIGDRHAKQDVAGVFRKSWDLVVDLSGTDTEMIRYAMEAARGMCGRYVFVSSSSVYTVGGSSPHQEDETLRSGTGEPYARAKIMGERLLRENFPRFTVIRPSKVYGPGNYYFSEWTFLSMLRESPDVFPGNDPILHFTFIDDLAEGMCALMDKDGIYNVAGPEPERLSTFIRLIGSLNGIEARIHREKRPEARPMPFADLSDRVLDLRAAERTAGWKPRVSLEEGLRRTFHLMEGQGRPR
jgi:nucleoside-diphosphate-sugar epimerase